MSNLILADERQTSYKPRNIKTHNRRLIVGLLQQNEALSATNISERISLSKTSVTRILNELVEKNLVKMNGKGSSTTEGGKRPELFALNENFCYLIVAHFGVSCLECALLNAKCEVIEKTTEKYSDRTNYARCFGQLVNCIEKLEQETRRRGGKLAYIVVGCQGVVDSSTGTMCYTAHSRWNKDITLRKNLKESLSFKTNIIVENVCRLAGYAELLLHPELEEELVVTITSDRTAGGCVLDHGVLIQGANGFVGEIGHIMVEPRHEESCICGGKGCFEMMVSPQALCQKIHEMIAQYPDSMLRARAEAGDLSAQDVFEAADKGDQLACELMDNAAHYFSILIHNIGLLCDPQHIIIQGLYANAGIYFVERLRSVVAGLPFFEIKRNLQLLYSSIEYFSSVFLGGAFFAVNQILDDGSLYLEETKQTEREGERYKR